MSTIRRASACVGAVAAAVLATTIGAASPAAADTSSTLTVVGTSDVYDSYLVQTVIKPGFEALYPGVTLNYISKGTGAAIAYAETGAASAMIVHAASLENQFVAAGYSTEQYGRAAFWGDYVLLGPQNDPAAIGSRDRHDIVGAFERLANLGAQGRINFVSRGGTPGTTVQEHAIWALTNGVTTCDVSDVNGGGESPSTTTGPCPTTISYPSWYHTTGLSQGPNVLNADACNYPSANNNCYVLTDRGTFNYLQSTGQAQNLKIVTRNNGRTARGGVPLLVNSFHAYSVNPDAFSDPTVAAKINKTAALNFLNYLTSSSAQAAIGAYLNGQNDPPFIPDAEPRLTATAPPAGSTGRAQVSITGTLSNVVPGTPPLSGETVTLFGTDNADPAQTTQIATATTNANGKYTLTFRVGASRTYTVRTDQISKIEYPGLDPVFGDLLAPTSATAGANEVTGAVTITKAVPSAGTLKLAGVVAPAPVDDDADLILLASKDGADEESYGRIPLTAGQTNFSKRFSLDPGTYDYRLVYDDGVYISRGSSSTRTANVP